MFIKQISVFLENRPGTLRELTAVLGGLVDRGVARFATGEIELNDETYAAWLSELKAAGSDELVAMYEEN